MCLWVCARTHDHVLCLCVCMFMFGGALANNGDFPFHYVLEFQQHVMKSRLIKTIERCVLVFSIWVGSARLSIDRRTAIAYHLNTVGR